jgi:hypothetical protein
MNNNPAKLLFNLTDTALDVVKKAVKSGVILTGEDKIVLRKEICANCEHLEKTEVRCKLCGCYMKIKVTFDAAKCPIDKW